MKKSEFIGKMKDYGYKVTEEGPETYVTFNSLIQAVVNNNSKNVIDTYEDNILSDEAFGVIIKYSKTPIEEREEEPKYYWVIANERFSDKANHYFHFDKGKRAFFLSWKYDATERYNSQFTEKEFFEIEKALDIVGWFKKGEKVE